MAVLAEAAPHPLPRRSWLLIWLALLAAAAVLMAVADPASPMVVYPADWELPLKTWISAAIKWLVNEADLGLLTFKELTRHVSWLLQQPLDLANSLLVDGFSASDDPKAPLLVPPLSWAAVVAVAGLLAFRAGGRALGVMVGFFFLYLAAFGWWQSAMVTLSSIVIAVPLAAAGGLLLGIAAYRHAGFERAITPVLDLMQTTPIFAYLVPILFLFGFGPVAAMIATIIYAMPPMVRVTALALRQVPAEVVEFGRMAGCSRRQMMWRVMVPAARPGLMVGVNQVIMLSLNMVIIASMIGAGGLGFDVLDSLKRLDIGKGLEAGLSITLLAVALDRMSQAWADRPPPLHTEAEGGFVRRHLWFLVILAAGVLPTLAAKGIGFLQAFPEGWQLTTGPMWSGLVEWINVNFFEHIDAVKNALLINVLVPLKRALVAVPWVAVVVMVAAAGFQAGGIRLAALVGGLGLFIAVTGNWEKAMVTVYLVAVSVVLAVLIGVPIGVWAAHRPRVNRVVQAVIDTLQTLPSFVYLIPVVMLFQVGDTSAIIAIVAYAVCPAIRYTIHGLRQVPPHLVEAARAAGCSRGQVLRKVLVPLALPEMMLGLNQTIMMALSMLVITALVGTRDLGQEVYIALAKADTGRGIVAGLCVAFLAIITDRLIGAWAARRKRELGLA